jgi:hypothetical protein
MEMDIFKNQICQIMIIVYNDVMSSFLIPAVDSHIVLFWLMIGKWTFWPY